MSRRVSSYDKTGGNRDAWLIKGGEKKVIADIKGWAYEENLALNR